MNDQELKDLVASLAVAQKETDRQLKETGLQLKETGQHFKETDMRQKETDQQLKETGRLITELRISEAKANEELRQSINELKKQLGGLGNKFGDFSEGMAIPSLIEILGKRFEATQIIETKRVRKGEDEIELDLIGASNGDLKTVVAAEVKSVLNQRELEKFIRNLKRFFHFFPQFKGYRLFGVLAAVQSSNEMDAASVAQGLCVARMHGDVFRLKVPPDFQPKDFSMA